jgi:hypothetical protein
VVVSTWPAVSFVLAVEVALGLVRRGRQEPLAVPAAVPAGQNGHKPIPSVREVRETYQCSQQTAEKIRKAMRTRIQ